MHIQERGGCEEFTESEQGSATVLFAELAALLVVVGLVLAGFAAVLTARQQAQGVADMAALAGADRSSVAAYVVGGAAGDACDLAGQVADANGFELSTCEVRGSDTFVEVSKRVGVLITARARAGPPEG